MDNIMLRIGLFILTNLAVMVMLSLVASLTGLDRHAGGLLPLLVYSAVIGFTGSMFSLLLSKIIAKWTTGAKVIAQPSNEVEAWLLQTVKRQADAAGIGMPEVAIYPAPESNAFATGAFKNSALVAVSVGLLNNMRRDEVEAVLAHEVSHIANGDMVTMALLQGVLNTFVVLISRVVAQIADSALRRDNDNSGPGFVYFIVSMLMQVVGVLASIILAWFSRRREFRADAGAAKLAGAGKMVAALERLKGGGESSLPQSVQAMGISGHKAMRLFATHPPLDDRIAALRGH
jgi:heat shock protein HtpX